MIRSHLKFALMNWMVASALIAFGALLTNLGRNDPPQPVVLKVLLIALFAGCPLLLGAFGPSMERFLGIAILFSAFGLNVRALHRHAGDPAGTRNAQYAKRK
jgi:hypothetical protein